MSGHLMPDDANWPGDKELLAELSRLNTHVTRYVMRHLDADAGRAEPVPVMDERALSVRLAAAAHELRARAARRERLGNQPSTVEGMVGEEMR